MKKNRFLPDSGGMMIELVVGIIFFVVISLFTFNIFLKTEQYKNDADELSEAMFRAETVIEQIRGIKERERVYERILGSKVGNSGAEYVAGYYDIDWNKKDIPDRYTVTVTVNEQERGHGIFSEYTVNIYKTKGNSEKKEIYSLKSSKFWDGGRK